jgi:hypothetical protein
VLPISNPAAFYFENDGPNYPLLRDVVVDSSTEIDLEAGRPYDDSFVSGAKRGLYNEIRVCLKILKSSRLNLDCHQKFVDRDLAIKNLWSCHSPGAALGLLGIPAVILLGALICHTSIAYGISNDPTFLFLSYFQARSRQDDFIKIYNQGIETIQNSILSHSQIKHECDSEYLMHILRHDQGGFDRVECLERWSQKNSAHQQALTQFIADHAADKAYHEQTVNAWSWDLPLPTLFIFACLCSVVYVIVLHKSRGWAQQDYTRASHTLDECLPAIHIPRIINLAQRLNVDISTSVEELIETFEASEQLEAFNETLFIFWAFLSRQQFPKELISCMLQKALELRSPQIPSQRFA